MEGYNIGIICSSPATAVVGVKGFKIIILALSSGAILYTLFSFYHSFYANQRGSIPN